MITKWVLMGVLVLGCAAQVEHEDPCYWNAAGQVEDGCGVADLHVNECAGLSRFDVGAGYCVRILPKYDGPPIAYGPSCGELVTPDQSNAICAAWVTVEPESVWVNEAIVDVEAWSGSAEGCSCL